MCCTLALQVCAFILVTLSKAETSSDLFNVQPQHARAEDIVDPYPRTSSVASLISRTEGLQDFDGFSAVLDSTLKAANLKALEQLVQKVAKQSRFDTAQEVSQSVLALDQQFASIPPQSQSLSTLQSSAGQEQEVKAESQLGVEIKQTSRVAALLAQDAASLAKELAAINNALRGAQGFNPNSPAQVPAVQLEANSAAVWAKTAPLAMNLAEVPPVALSASANELSNSSSSSSSSSTSSGSRCGGKDQLACNSTNAYWTMNYRVPLWLGVILWVLIWVCIICFCVGLCINIFKPNALAQ